MPSGGVLSLSDPVDAPELSQAEMNAIVEEAHHWGRKVAAHCHGAFCHADDEGPAATKSSSDPLSHAQGSLEHRGVAVLAPDLTIYVPELMLAGELALAAPRVEHVAYFERRLPPARAPPT